MEEFRETILALLADECGRSDLPQAESKDPAMVLFDKATMAVQQEPCSVANLTLQAKLMLQTHELPDAAGYRPQAQCEPKAH